MGTKAEVNGAGANTSAACLRSDRARSRAPGGRDPPRSAVVCPHGGG